MIIYLGSINDYVAYIESFPLNPSPEAFGLHDNAEITNSVNETRDMLETILSGTHIITMFFLIHL